MIKVVGGVQVAHDGVVHPGGSTAEVPDEVAQVWLESGWVTEVAPSVPKARRRTAPAK